MKIKEIKNLVDYKKMEELAFREDFTDYGFEKTECLSSMHGESFYWYKDNGSDILAVAHLDSVVYEPHFQMLTIKNNDYVYCSRFDDRIGVYIILDLLPKLGITVDWLLTTDEEMGASTAEQFETEKKYRWAFSFDRAGSDVVLYQYESKKIAEALVSSKFKIGVGSFSDIGELEFLGCKCFNVGSGVENEHSAWANVNMLNLLVQVRKFSNFHYKYKDTFFHHSPYSGYNKRYTGYGNAYPVSNRGYIDNVADEWDVPVTTRKQPKCQVCFGSPPAVKFTHAEEGYEAVCDDCLYYVDQCRQCGTVTVYENLSSDMLCPTCRDKNAKEDIDCMWCGDLDGIECAYCTKRKGK